jgi:hypothetical protein
MKGLQGSDMSLVEFWAKSPKDNNGWHKIRAKFSFWYIDVSMDGSSLVRKWRWGFVGKLYKRYWLKKNPPFEGKIAEVKIWSAKK